MKRWTGLGLLWVILSLVAVPRVQAQTFNTDTNRQLISYVSFYAGPNSAVISTWQAIASYSTNHIEIHQVWLRVLDSLSSFKMRGAQGSSGDGDITPWMPIKLFSATGGSADQLPFENELNMAPPKAALGDTSRQLYWHRLESGARLMIDTRGGAAAVFGFLRFKYQPTPGR